MKLFLKIPFFQVILLILLTLSISACKGAKQNGQDEALKFTCSGEGETQVCLDVSGEEACSGGDCESFCQNHACETGLGGLTTACTQDADCAEGQSCGEGICVSLGETEAASVWRLKRIETVDTAVTSGLLIPVTIELEAQTITIQHRVPETISEGVRKFLVDYKIEASSGEVFAERVEHYDENGRLLQAESSGVFVIRQLSDFLWRTLNREDISAELLAQIQQLEDYQYNESGFLRQYERAYRIPPELLVPEEEEAEEVEFSVELPSPRGEEAPDRHTSRAHRQAATTSHFEAGPVALRFEEPEPFRVTCEYRHVDPGQPVLALDRAAFYNDLQGHNPSLPWRPEEPRLYSDYCPDQQGLLISETISHPDRALLYAYDAAGRLNSLVNIDLDSVRQHMDEEAKNAFFADPLARNGEGRFVYVQDLTDFRRFSYSEQGNLLSVESFVNNRGAGFERESSIYGTFADDGRLQNKTFTHSKWQPELVRVSHQNTGDQLAAIQVFLSQYEMEEQLWKTIELERDESGRIVAWQKQRRQRDESGRIVTWQKQRRRSFDEILQRDSLRFHYGQEWLIDMIREDKAIVTDENGAETATILKKNLLRQVYTEDGRLSERIYVENLGFSDDVGNRFSKVERTYTTRFIWEEESSETVAATPYVHSQRPYILLDSDRQARDGLLSGFTNVSDDRDPILLPVNYKSLFEERR